MEQVGGWIVDLFVAGCLAYFAYETVKNFGWQGLLVKCAWAVDGFLLCGFVV